MVVDMTQDEDSRGSPLTPREWLLGVAVGLWMVVGLFLDGLAHDDGRPESFFTPWHGVLYSGFAAAVAVAGVVTLRRREPGRSILTTLPPGHGLTLLGLVGFGIGGLADLVWHETFGIEVGAEALLSPSHLLLLVSGLIALSAPVRDVWRSPSAADPTFGDLLPAILTLALMTGVAGFFLAYLSPFVNDAASQAFDPRVVPHEHPSSDPRELRQLVGLSSILMTTVVLATAMELVLARWRRPPVGTLALLLAGSVSFLVALDEFDEASLILVASGAGLAADWLVHRHGRMVATSTAITILWIGYFGTYQLVEEGVAWSAELIGGAIVLSALLAFGLGLIRTSAVQADSRRYLRDGFVASRS